MIETSLNNGEEVNLCADVFLAMRTLAQDLKSAQADMDEIRRQISEVAVLLSAYRQQLEELPEKLKPILSDACLRAAETLGAESRSRSEALVGELRTLIGEARRPWYKKIFLYFCRSK